MNDQIEFEIKGIGFITMKGTGPWSVREYSGHSRTIHEANDREANPFVRSKLRNSSNVVFANLADAKAVVDKANELLAARG